MIDHTGVGVSNFARSKDFYIQVLKPIGYKMLVEIPSSVTGKEDVAGFGEPNKPDFWINSGSPQIPPVHIAFRVQSRKQVQNFYNAAIQAGGKDNGEPGLRPHYHPDYYGAFILDPDGHNIEAVCHNKE